jgi:hypothetical protein
MQQAIQLISEMGTNYPELYVFLDETPLFLSTISGDQIHISDFEKHLETLKAQLQGYIYPPSHLVPSKVVHSILD